MGGDKATKAQEKLEKKRIKAQYKLDKEKLKEQSVGEPDRAHPQYGKPRAREPLQQESTTPQVKEVPWYKNPAWLRAIAAIASLIVMIIAVVISLR
jgi:hypothetical protein